MKAPFTVRPAVAFPSELRVMRAGVAGIDKPSKEGQHGRDVPSGRALRRLIERAERKSKT